MRSDSAPPTFDRAALKSLPKSMLAWFAENARDLPWRRTEDPYGVWVSEIMLQQTQVKTVIPYWERWMRELPTIRALAEASPEQILKLWEGLGYYSRVRNMQKAAQQILAFNKGIFPPDYNAVLDLPGIGRYTAGAICSIAFNQPTPILDGNVIRVLTRVLGISGNVRDRKTNDHLWELATGLVGEASRLTARRPKFLAGSGNGQSCSFFNQSMMELGALVCTPRSPRCSECPLQPRCVAYRDNRIEKLPNVGPRAVTTNRRFAAFIVRKENRYLVRQRPSGVVNGGLWEFPNIEILGQKTLTDTPFKIGKQAKPFCTVKHSITRYRICLDAFLAELPDTSREKPGTWRSLDQLQALALPSAHKKILQALIDQRARA